MTEVGAFIDCPQCHGYGYTMTTGGKHIVCSLCQAKQSTFGFVENDLLYWSKTISPTTVVERKLEHLIEQIITSVLLVISVIGLLSFALTVLQVQLANLPLQHIFGQRSVLLLLFWLSTIADLFLYYRIVRAIDRRPQIRVANTLVGLVLPASVMDWSWWRKLPDRKKIDVSKSYSETALNIIDQAYHLANQSRHQEVKPIHLVLALSHVTEVRNMFYRLEINYQDLQHAFVRMAGRLPPASEATMVPQFGSDIRKTVLLAYVEARKQKRHNVGVMELLMACVLSDQVLQDALFERDIDVAKLRNLVRWSNLVHDLIQQQHGRYHKGRSKPKTIMNRAMTARPTPTLDSVSQDFTVLARSNQFLPVVGRDHETEEAFRVLQEGHSSVLFVGQSGTGKTSLLQGIAQLMTAEDVPASLQDKRFVVTEPGALIAGAGGVGGVEGRMQTIIYEVMRAGNIIWGIEDIHTLLGAGSTDSSIDIGKILMNYISQGYIKVVGTTTTPEYQKYIENQETFARRFQVVQVPDLKPADAIQVLCGRAPFLESHYGVYFTYDALVACVTLTERFIQDRHLPAKALDVMEETAVYTKEHGGRSVLVTTAAVQAVMSEKTNVSLSAISQDEANKLLNLEVELAERVIGQTEALEAVARALRRAREDIRDTQRPIASLLFLGPTGVGKTETAKALAAAYFGSEHSMLRFDMSEYDTPESLSKLIGAPGQQGHLTEAVRRTPYGILLLDELEKAHPEALNLLLQVMEDGRLTDGTGRTLDFSNLMILATSNAGTELIQRRYDEGATPVQIEEELLSANLLKEYFRPELLNRFDRVVVFTPFTPEELLQVCQLMLQQLAKQLDTKGIILQWTDEAVNDLSARGYNRQYGARPLRRLIQDTVQDAIAKLMLSKEIARRDTVQLQAGGKVVVIKATPI